MQTRQCGLLPQVPALPATPVPAPLATHLFDLMVQLLKWPNTTFTIVE